CSPPSLFFSIKSLILIAISVKKRFYLLKTVYNKGIRMSTKKGVKAPCGKCKKYVNLPVILEKGGV
ncbi:MAG: hypothetical protein IKV54_04695, partial [Clostridia bacterium]|nr:hypothetical protein [Clostridia bacterium]